MDFRIARFSCECKAGYDDHYTVLNNIIKYILPFPYYLITE